MYLHQPYLMRFKTCPGLGSQCLVVELNFIPWLIELDKPSWIYLSINDMGENLPSLRGPRALIFKKKFFFFCLWFTNWKELKIFTEKTIIRLSQAFTMINKFTRGAEWPIWLSQIKQAWMSWEIWALHALLVLLRFQVSFLLWSPSLGSNSQLLGIKGLKNMW